MRWIFSAPITYVKTDGLENVYNLMLKIFCSSMKHIITSNSFICQWPDVIG